jgi:hypothetical protein
VAIETAKTVQTEATEKAKEVGKEAKNTAETEAEKQNLIDSAEKPVTTP